MLFLVKEVSQSCGEWPVSTRAGGLSCYDFELVREIDSGVW